MHSSKSHKKHLLSPPSYWRNSRAPLCSPPLSFISSPPSISRSPVYLGSQGNKEASIWLVKGPSSPPSKQRTSTASRLISSDSKLREREERVQHAMLELNCEVKHRATPREDTQISKISQGHFSQVCTKWAREILTGCRNVEKVRNAKLRAPGKMQVVVPRDLKSKEFVI